MHSSSDHSRFTLEEGGSPLLRSLLLGVIVLGIAGLIGELVLLEHYDSPQQWIPLASLIVGLLTSLALARHATRGRVRFFRLVMVLFLLAGALGIYFHLEGNLEFELERNRSLSGMKLIWEVLRGATPALAPGALAQIGLLGLVYAYRHPALNRVDDPRNPPVRSI